MKISDELRDRILADCNNQKERLLEVVSKIESKCDNIVVPIYLDGCMDMVTYNIPLKKFTRIDIFVAAGDVSTAFWLKGSAVYCDKFELATIEL